MSRTVPSALQSLLEGASTRLASCVAIEPVNNLAPIYLTDHDRDIALGGATYSSRDGFTRSAVTSTETMETGSVTVEGILNPDVVNVETIRTGGYDYAPARMLAVDWSDPSAGSVTLIRGSVGEIRVLSDLGFRFEIRDLKQQLSTVLGERYGPECRADLGDTRCKVPITTAMWQSEATVSAVTDNRSFQVTITGTAPTEDNWFVGGSLTWKTGDNTGLSAEIRGWSSGNAVALWLAMAGDVAVGDTLSMRPGCDKSLATCIERFDNRLNFRGEPFLPGRDFMAQVAATAEIGDG